MLHKNQIFFLLQSLQPKEVRDLHKFLISPFFNQREDVVILFDFLMKKIRREQRLPNKEKIFSIVYPKKTFDAQAFRQLISWLQQLIEKYLSHQVMMENEWEVKMKLASIFRERDLLKHYQKMINDSEKILSKIETRNADFYNFSLSLEQEKYLLSSGKKRMTSRNFETLSENLNLGFIIQKLQQACRLAAHQAVYNFDLELGLLKEVLKYIEEKNLDDNPTIAAYLNCYQALIYPEREDFFRQFKKILFENTERFPTNELRDLYLLAINFCIRRLNEGYHEFAQEGLNLYKNAIELKVLFLNGVLSRFAFQNIVAMGLKVKEFDWVEHFIQDNHHYLRKDHKEGNYAFNMAVLEYHRKNYDAVLELLQIADYQDVLMSLSAKTLAAKVYFELDEDDLLDAHLHTMQMFIRRKKVMGYHRKNYLNFIRFLKKMVAERNAIKPDFFKLFHAISEEEILTQKEWFLEQKNMVKIKK